MLEVRTSERCIIVIRVRYPSLFGQAMVLSIAGIPACEQFYLLAM